MASLRISKSTSIVFAALHLNGETSSGAYNHADLTLYAGDPGDSYNKVVALSFQRHRLDYNPYGISERYAHNPAEVERDMPPSEWDFGDFPFSKFYGGHLASGRDISSDSNGARKLTLIAKLFEKIDNAIRAYNLRAVTQDELKQWVAALEKLGVRVDTQIWWQRQKVYTVAELPGDKQYPSAKLLKTMRLQQEPQAPTITG